MPRVTTSQTYYVPLTHRLVGTDGGSRAKVSLAATGIGIAGIAAAYMNRDAVQSILREKYEFSSKNLVYPLLMIGLLGSLGAAGIYLWKRNALNNVPDITVINHQVSKESETKPHILIKENVVDQSEPQTTIPIKTEPTKTPKKTFPLAEDEKGVQAVISLPETATTNSKTTEPKQTDEKPKEKPVLDNSEIKKTIDAVIDKISVQNQDLNTNKNALVANLSPIFKRVNQKSTHQKKYSNPNHFKDTYERAAKHNQLYKELSDASKLIKSSETHAYRKKNCKVGVADNLMKDYKAKLKKFLKFAKTLTTIPEGQKLLENSYDKLLAFSKKRACKLAIHCIGKPFDGCNAIVKRAFTDLVSAADKIEKSYEAKYENAANKDAFKKQFDPMADKIMQYAGNFIIECMEKRDPECRDIIEDAFPILLAEPSLSALKFAIYCLEQPIEKYKTKAESYKEKLSDLVLYEAMRKKKLPGTSLLKLMKKNKREIDEKEVLNFDLNDLRESQFYSGKTLVISSDEQSREDDDRSFGEDDDSPDPTKFDKCVSDVLKDLKSFFPEEDDNELGQ